MHPWAFLRTLPTLTNLTRAITTYMCAVSLQFDQIMAELKAQKPAQHAKLMQVPLQAWANCYRVASHHGVDTNNWAEIYNFLLRWVRGHSKLALSLLATSNLIEGRLMRMSTSSPGVDSLLSLESMTVPLANSFRALALIAIARNMHSVSREYAASLVEATAFDAQPNSRYVCGNTATSE